MDVIYAFSPLIKIVTCMCISQYIEETCEWQAYVSIKGASCPSCGRFCAVRAAEESQAMSNRLHSYVFSGNRARAPRATPARHPVRDKKLAEAYHAAASPIVPAPEQ